MSLIDILIANKEYDLRNEPKKLKRFVIRFDNKEKGMKLEGDRYSYYVSSKNGVVMTTPFKDKATILTEGDEISLPRNCEYKTIIVR